MKNVVKIFAVLLSTLVVCFISACDNKNTNSKLQSSSYASETKVNVTTSDTNKTNIIVSDESVTDNETEVQAENRTNEANTDSLDKFKSNSTCDTTDRQMITKPDENNIPENSSGNSEEKLENVSDTPDTSEENDFFIVLPEIEI